MIQPPSILRPGLVRRPRRGLRACGIAATACLLGATLSAAVGPPIPALAQAPDPPPTPTLVERVGTSAPQQATATPSSTRPPFPTRPPPPTETPYPPTGTATTRATATQDETAAAPELPHEERPLIVVEGFDVNPDRPSPGATFGLTLFVKNEGEHFAENVQLTLTSNTFLPADQGGVLYANSIDEDDSVDLGVQLRVASDAKAGVYPLTVALRWDDSYGGAYEDQTTIGIEVGGASATRPLLTVIGTHVPGRVAPGVPFNVVLDLLNTGGREARSVVVAPAAGPLAIQGGGGGPLNIPPGASATVSLRATAASPADPGAASQVLEVRYDDPDGTRYTESQSVGLVVTGDAGRGPQPMITAYRVVDPTVRGLGNALSTLHPGEVFALQLDILNAGVADALSARLSLGGGSAPSATGTGTSGASGASLGVFAPVGTSNVRFLDRLAAGAARTVEQRLVIDGGAKPGVYVLEVAFDYVDPDGQALSSSEVISLLVDQQVAFEVKPVSVITSTMAGESVPFVVDLINLGSTTVNVTNVEVRALENMSVPDPISARQYVGPLDGGGFFTLETTVTADAVPAATEKAQVAVVVEYFDSFKQLQTFEKTFDFEVEEAPEEPDVPVMPTPEPIGMPVRILKGFLGLGASPPPAPAMFEIGDGPPDAVRMDGP